MHVQRVGILQALHSFQLPPAVRTQGRVNHRNHLDPELMTSHRIGKNQEHQKEVNKFATDQSRHHCKRLSAPLADLSSLSCISCIIFSSLSLLLFNLMANQLPLRIPSCTDHPETIQGQCPLLVEEQAPNSLTTFVVVFNPHHCNDCKIVQSNRMCNTYNNTSYL